MPQRWAARRKWRRWVLLALVGAAAAAAWLGAGELTRRSLVSYLPEVPHLGGAPPARAEIIRRAAAAARAEPHSADRVGHLGKVYFANLYYDRAAACFDRAAELDDDGRWQWMYYRVLLMEQRGEVAAAAKMLRRIVQMRGKFAMAWYRLAQAEFKLGHQAAAEKAYQKAAALDRHQRPAGTRAGEAGFPVSAHARFQLARIAFRKGDHQRALTMLGSLLKVYEDFGPARRLLGQVYQALGRDAEASRQTKLAAGLRSYVPPVDPISEQLVQLSRSSTFLLKRASVATRGGRFRRAEELIRRAKKYEPDDLMATCQLGEILKATGRPEEALPHLMGLLDIYPEKANTLGVIADCLDATGRPEEAIEYYRRALELRPDDVRITNNLATVLLQQNRLAEGEQLLRDLLARKPDIPEALGNLGRLLVMTGRADEAIDYFRRGLARRPENVQMRTDLAIVLVRCQQAEEGIAQFRESLQYSPNYPPALSNLSAALVGCQRFEEALRVAARLVEVLPKDPAAHLRYAVAAAGLGRRDQALEHCRIALMLDRSFAEARRLLDRLER